MIRQLCSILWQVYIPKNPITIPYIVMMNIRIHSHLLPLLSKTPYDIKKELLYLIQQNDLINLTVDNYYLF